MSRAEILTMRNPKVSNMDSIGISTAGGITSADISAACCNANPVGEKILLSKICGSRGEQKPIFYRMYNEVVKLATKQGWQVKKRGEDRVRSVLQLAIYESVTQFVCPTCRGTKWSKIDPTKPCTPCKGTGKWRMLDADKAEVTGISRQAWSQTWKHRYDDVLLLLENYEHSALISIIRLLK